MSLQKSIRIYFAVAFLSGMFITVGCTKEESAPEIKDGDGNIYTPVKIGTQTWLKENLRTARYNDGSSIVNATDDTQWKNLTVGGYCWYENDITNKPVYGALYNWHAVNSGKLCPNGYRMPTRSDWETLIDFLGGNAIAGGKLKESGTLHWESPNVADNSSGFTALPSGIRFYAGNFNFKGTYTFLWSATEEDALSGNAFLIRNNDDEIQMANSTKTQGYSCRCVEDN
jgi:uncharacterized protein (TIGR02145 family)